MTPREMENSIKIEGLVHYFKEERLNSGTHAIVLTLEHHRRGTVKLHTPWFFVFFIGRMYEQGKAEIVKGKRIRVTGRLDTTSYLKEGKKERRTYIQAQKLEVLG